MALHGVTKHIAQHAPSDWTVYFANEEDDVSCLLQELPVPVVHLRTGRRGRSGFVRSLVAALEQVPERWVLYAQEDTAIPLPESATRLLRLQQFAEERHALSVNLDRHVDGMYEAGEVFAQKGLGFSFVRNAGGPYVFNHGFCLSNKSWFIDHLKAYPGDGSPWGAENAANQVDLITELPRFYYVHYDSGLNGTTCDVNGPALNRWGCTVEPYRVDGLPLGLDRLVRIGHGSVFTFAGYANVSDFTHAQLGLASLGDGFRRACPWYR